MITEKDRTHVRSQLVEKAFFLYDKTFLSF